VGKNIMGLCVLAMLLVSCVKAGEHALPVGGVMLDHPFFENHWFGVIFERQSTLQSKMEIDLTNSAHKVSYFDLDCYGSITLQKVVGNTATFSQEIYVGTSQCQEMATIVLEKVGEHSVQYHSYDKAGKEKAVGMLVL